MDYTEYAGKWRVKSERLGICKISTYIGESTTVTGKRGSKTSRGNSASFCWSWALHREKSIYQVFSKYKCINLKVCKNVLCIHWKGEIQTGERKLYEVEFSPFSHFLSPTPPSSPIPTGMWNKLLTYTDVQKPTWSFKIKQMALWQFALRSPCLCHMWTGTLPYERDSDIFRRKLSTLFFFFLIQGSLIKKRMNLLIKLTEIQKTFWQIY